MDGKPERVRERERANHSVEPTNSTALRSVALPKDRHWRLSARLREKIELRSILLRQCFLGFRGQEQLEAEALGETLRGFGRESFEVITHKGPNVADLGEMALDFERPAFQSGLAFPKKFIVSMNE